MVRVAVQINRGHQRPAERIADLKVVLAAAYLADIPQAGVGLFPRGSFIHSSISWLATETSCVPEPKSPLVS